MPSPAFAMLTRPLPGQGEVLEGDVTARYPFGEGGEPSLKLYRPEEVATARADASRRALALRQTEDAFADDVVLDLAGAARDGEGAGGQHAIVPATAVEGERRAVFELAIGAE